MWRTVPDRDAAFSSITQVQREERAGCSRMSLREHDGKSGALARVSWEDELWTVALEKE